MLPMSPIREWLMRYRQPGAPSTGGNAQAMRMDQPVTGGNQPAMPMQTGGPMPAERIPTKPMMMGNPAPPVSGPMPAERRGSPMGIGRLLEWQRPWMRWNRF
jgi:hypothetical protein